MRNQNISSAVEQPQSPRSRWLTASFAAIAFVIGAAAIVAIGMLEARLEAAQVGAVLNINNVVVGIEQPHRPWPIIVGLAVLVAILCLGLLRWVPFQRRPLALVLSASFLIGAALLTVWGLVIAPPMLTETLASGVEPFGPQGLEGWVQWGGASVASHVIVLLGIASFIYSATRPRGESAVR